MLLQVAVIMLYVRVLWETQVPAICYSVVWIVFIILYAWNANFAYPVAGRMVYLIGEILMLAVFLIFLSKSSALNSNSFDMEAVVIVFFMDLFYLVAETRFYCINGGP